MLPDPAQLKAFEDKWAQTQTRDYQFHLRIPEAMLEEARLLGVWQTTAPLEGLEHDPYLLENSPIPLSPSKARSPAFCR